GGFEVARFSGGFHFGDLAIDVIVGELRGAGNLHQLRADFLFAAFSASPIENGFHFRLIVILEHGEYFVELLERREQRIDVVAANFRSVKRGVGFAQHVEHGGLGLGGVQVVVEGAFYLRYSVGGQLRHLRRGASGELGTGEAEAEVAQLLDRTGGRFQSVEGEIQLIAIGNLGEQPADGRRLVAAEDEVADGEEIAETLRHFLAFDEKKAGVKPEAGKGL